MKKGVCPKCGSKKLEEKLPVQSGLPFTMLYRGMMKDWVKVEATVCKECGYCELYVTEKHMKHLKEETVNLHVTENASRFPNILGKTKGFSRETEAFSDEISRGKSVLQSLVEIKKDVETKKRKVEQGKTCYNCKYYLNEDNVWCNSVKRWKNEYQGCEEWTGER